MLETIITSKIAFLRQDFESVEIFYANSDLKWAVILKFKTSGKTVLYFQTEAAAQSFYKEITDQL